MTSAASSAGAGETPERPGPEATSPAPAETPSASAEKSPAPAGTSQAPAERSPAPAEAPQGTDQTRASDADRERIADVLREAVAEGRLDMTEFEERLEAAYTARTHAQLAPLVRDLPAHAVAAAAVDPTWADRIGVANSAGRPSKGALSILGGFQRKGRWTVARRFTSFTLLGGGEIDLREARFAEREVTIRCFSLLGGVQITVDPSVDVQVNGIGVLGGFDQGGSGDPVPGAPRVTVTGLTLLGGVSVERKLRKEDRKRLKAAREQQREELALDHRERHRERRELAREMRRERHERQREARREMQERMREARLDRRDRIRRDRDWD